MNPQYQVQIVVNIAHPVTERSVEMRQVRYLPFVPYEGQVIRVTDNTDENQLDLTLTGVVYDTAGHMFICAVQDEDLLETFATSGSCDIRELVSLYESYDFQRVTYPTGQAIRHES